MRCRLPIGLLLAVAGPVLTGCRGPAHLVPPGPPDPPPLPVTARQLPAVDASRLPADAHPADEAVAYHRLTAEECRALACEQSPTGNLIDSLAFDPDPPRSDLTGRASAAHVRQVAAFHLSREARNRTAGAALDLYYRLQEAELLADVLAASRAEVDTLLKTAETMAARGFKESAEAAALRKRRIELQAEEARLRAGVRRLNGELKALTGLHATPGRLLPVDPIQVVPDPIVADQAVAVGLASRADLLLLRDLAAWLDPRTLAAVRTALGGLVSPFGAFSAAGQALLPGLRTLLPVLARSDVEEVRRQLFAALADRERTAAKDIRAAVDEWSGHRELVAVARRRLEAARDHERELDVRRQAGAAVEADWRRARLDRLSAEADLIRDAVAWKRADVKVRLETGLLCGAGGCGP